MVPTMTRATIPVTFINEWNLQKKISTGPIVSQVALIVQRLSQLMLILYGNEMEALISFLFENISDGTKDIIFNYFSSS